MTVLPPVLLLHGLATSAARTWRDTGWIDLLRDEGRHVVAPDLPGHGGRPPLADDEWDLIEEHVAAELPAGPLDAVGFSLGARILLTLASREPGRFRRLVLAGVGANLFRARSADQADLAAAFDGAAHDPAHPMVGHFLDLARSSGADPSAVASLLRRRQPPLDDLGSIEARVLVVLGDADFAGPADPLIERLPPGAELVTLRGVDHFATPKAMGFLDAGLRFLT